MKRKKKKKKPLAAQSQALSGNCTRKTEKNQEKPHDSEHPCRDSKGATRA